MIKTLSFFAATFFTFVASAQESWHDLKSSVLYINFTDYDSTTVYNYILTKKVLSDTTIGGKIFQKILWTKFKDFDENKITYLEYEHLQNKEFIKLDEDLRIIHRLKLVGNLEQQGTIFGKTGKIKFK